MDRPLNKGAADAGFYSFGMPFVPLDADAGIARDEAKSADTVCSTPKQNSEQPSANQAAGDAAFFSFGQPFSPLKEEPANLTATAVLPGHLQGVPAERPQSRHAPAKRIGRQRKVLGTLGQANVGPL